MRLQILHVVLIAFCKTWSSLNCSPQVPQAELETWLVQREQDPLPGGFPEQMRAAAGVERDLVVPNDEPTTVFGVLNEEEEEEEEAKEVFKAYLGLCVLQIYSERHQK